MIVRYFKSNTMSEHGAALQTYNLELVKCLEELKTKKQYLLEVINSEESDKATLEKNIRMLQDKLNATNHNLEQHKAIFESYEKTISESEMAFTKILESSQTLINLIQLETRKLPSCQDCKENSIRFQSKS